MSSPKERIHKKKSNGSTLGNPKERKRERQTQKERRIRRTATEIRELRENSDGESCLKDSISQRVFLVL